jgi:hypothetical protein
MVEIDQAEFRVPASDEKGHDRRLTIRLHPGYTTQLAKILESKWFPYETTHQIVRHALKRHLEWLETLAPITGSVLHRTNAILELLVEEEEQDKFQEVITKTERQVGTYLGSGRVQRARSLVKRVLDQVNEMPESQWKDQYQQELNHKFAYLLKSGMEANTPTSLFELVEEE